MELYVLRFDMYHDWSYENGACDLMGVYDSWLKALDELKKLLLVEQDVGRYLQLGHHNNVDEFINSMKERVSDIDTTPCVVDVYKTEGSYLTGFNDGSYIIEKKVLNNEVM